VTVNRPISDTVDSLTALENKHAAKALQSPWILPVDNEAVAWPGICIGAGAESRRRNRDAEGIEGRGEMEGMFHPQPTRWSGNGAGAQPRLKTVLMHYQLERTHPNGNKFRIFLKLYDT